MRISDWSSDVCSSDLSRGLGLTRPELSVLLSYDKMRLFQQLLDSDVPEDPYLSKELVRYFTEPLHEKYAEHMQRHRLKREILATAEIGKASCRERVWQYG